MPSRQPAPNQNVAGMLDIWLTWTGNADMDLVWTTPNNFSICPFNGSAVGCAQTSPDGAVASIDSAGPNGMESVLFADSYPPGNHIGTAQLFNGVSADFTIDMKLNGNVISSFSGTLDQQNPELIGVVNVPASSGGGGHP